MTETSETKPKCGLTGGLDGGQRLCFNRKYFKIKQEDTERKLLPVRLTHLLQVRKFPGKNFIK